MAFFWGGVAGALREPIDSDRSFPVILAPKMVFATLEIFLCLIFIIQTKKKQKSSANH